MSDEKKLEEETKTLTQRVKQAMPDPLVNITEDVSDRIRNITQSNTEDASSIGQRVRQVMPDPLVNMTEDVTDRLKNMTQNIPTEQVNEFVKEVAGNIDAQAIQKSIQNRVTNILTPSTNNRVYTGLADLPHGHASNQITEGCLVLEGGAFRGVYTSGVCDALMKSDINLRTTIGVSAGGLNGIGYVAGQIGRCGWVNLKFANDPHYVGAQALRKNGGVIGFDYLFTTINKEWPIDDIRFNAPNRRFLVAATNCETGEVEYFERGKCSDIYKAIQASATMPYISLPVEVDGTPYLDGGCSVHSIPMGIG